MPSGVYERTEAHRAILRGRDVTDTPTHSSMHFRIRTRRGSAREQQCVDCGGQAREWAYKEPTGFSTNVDDYVPLCTSCHKRRDRPNGRERKVS